MHGSTFVDFVDFGVYRRMASLRKCYSVTLTYFLKVKIRNVNISEAVRAGAKMHGTSFEDF